MTKAADIEITAEEPYGLAAARVVRVRAGELVAQADGVLDTSDIERVHAMRVTSRRLRAALEIFEPCFPREPYREVLGDVKRLADALGARRDPDVQIEGLEAIATQVDDALRPGVHALVDDLRGEQADGNDALARELERMHASDLHGRLRALADAAERLGAGTAADDGAGPSEVPTP